MNGSESLGITPAQFWRELCVMLGLWLLGRRLPYQMRVENKAGLTVAVTLCEDRETYYHNFMVVPRYHRVEQESIN